MVVIVVLSSARAHNHVHIKEGNKSPCLFFGHFSQMKEGLQLAQLQINDRDSFRYVFLCAVRHQTSM